MSKKTPETRLATHTNEELYYRDDGLVSELMGNFTFTEMMFMHILGRKPSSGDVVILDAVLLTLMEHGLTPSAISTRLTYHSAPEALQSAVAAGLLNVGSQFIGTLENASTLLMALLNDADEFDVAARRKVKELRAAKHPLPGFGHHLHRPDDPRTEKLFQIALAQDGIKGTYIDAMKRLSAIIDDELGKHLTINATGAVAAVMLELDVPPEIMRGFAVISRSAGLVAHIHEEQSHPTARHIWDIVEETVPYTGDALTKKN
ncbi:citryl-CoA lyase [Rhodospirillales bacterium]|nr:citryl-CoA lyase [Rhodospirillales bacterium]